jgi:phage shock protein C
MSGDYKKLHRSRNERMIAGVCGGIGEYFSVDPTLIRVIFVVFAVFSGGMWLLAYILMAVIMPEEPEAPVNTATPGPASQDAAKAGETGANTSTKDASPAEASE